MDLLDALDRATGEFRTRLEHVRPDDWTRPTPCDEWDVRMLVSHVVGGNRFAASVLSGSSARAAMDAVLSTVQLGTDALDDFDRVTATQRAAFRRDGALDATCDHVAGNIAGAHFLVMRTFDVTVHAWDLARGIAADDRLDADLCATVVATVAALPTDLGRGLGRVPSAGDADPDDPQIRLLQMAGRSR